MNIDKDFITQYPLLALVELHTYVIIPINYISLITSLIFYQVSLIADETADVEFTLCFTWILWLRPWRVYLKEKIFNVDKAQVNRSFCFHLIQDMMSIIYHRYGNKVQLSLFSGFVKVCRDICWHHIPYKYNRRSFHFYRCFSCILQ